MAATAVAALLMMAPAGCSGSTPDESTPGTSAVLGGSGASISTTTDPSNSEGGIPANPGSVAQQRPPVGE